MPENSGRTETRLSLDSTGSEKRSLWLSSVCSLCPTLGSMLDVGCESLAYPSLSNESVLAVIHASASTSGTESRVVDRHLF